METKIEYLEGAGQYYQRRHNLQGMSVIRLFDGKVIPPGQIFVFDNRIMFQSLHSIATRRMYESYMIAYEPGSVIAIPGKITAIPTFMIRNLRLPLLLELTDYNLRKTV